MSKKLTKNQRAALAELKRIQRAQKRYEKRGYVFDESFLPKQPKRISKKYLEQLQQIKGSKIRLSATGFETSGGLTNVIPAKPKQEQMLRGLSVRDVFYRNQGFEVNQLGDAGNYFTDIVLTNIEELLNKWKPESEWSDLTERKKERDKNILKRILDDAIASHGRDTVAARLDASTEDIKKKVEYILYAVSKGNGTNSQLVDLAYILNGGALTFEQNVELTDYAEYGIDE